MKGPCFALGVIGIGVTLLLAVQAASQAVADDSVAAPPDKTAETGKSTAAGQSAAAPADPLAARGHLPMPWRIIGASFISLEKGEAGWTPGLMADGYYLVDFDEFGLVWRHADIEDHYACTLGKDGAFEGRDRAGARAEGRVDLARGELTWQGKKYRVRTYEEIAREKKALEPALKPTDAACPIKSADGKILQIDLKSEQRGGAGLTFAMGHLHADYLGHQGEWALLRIYTDIELGEDLALYRLPISDGTATIQIKANLPSYSFGAAKSKVVWHGVGRFFGDGSGWTATAEDRTHPANNHHDIINANGGTSAYVLTRDMQPGRGDEVQPRTRVHVRLWFYADKDYTMLRTDARQGEKIIFTVGPWRDDAVRAYMSDGVSKALDGMVRGMKAGGWRRAQMNQVVAQDLEKLLPGMKAGEVVYIEVNLLTIEGSNAGRPIPPEYAPEALVGTVKEVPEGNWTNDNPPTVVVQVLEVWRGGLKVPSELAVTWAAPDSGIDTSGREAQLEAWKKTRLELPKVGTKWIIFGTMSKKGLVSATDGNVAWTAERAARHRKLVATVAPPAFIELNQPAFLKSFNDAFKDDLETAVPGPMQSSSVCTFTYAEDGRPIMLLPVRPRHEGFFIVRYEITVPAEKEANTRKGGEKFACEFPFTVGKKDTPRYLNYANGNNTILPVCNVGDTILLPLAQAANDGTFSATTHVRTKGGNDAEAAAKHLAWLAEDDRKAIAEFDALPKHFPPNDLVKLTNHAEPGFKILGVATERFRHRISTRATDSCNLLLEAVGPGEFSLSTSVTPETPAMKRQHFDPTPLLFDPIPLVVVGRDQAITVMLRHYLWQRVSGDELSSTTSYSEYRPRANDPGAPATVLRVGDRLTMAAWREVIEVDGHTGQPVQPHALPAITLEKKAQGAL